jgi:hypothetical protein
MNRAPATQEPTKPNPEAVAALYERLIWWLAKREAERRAELIKQQGEYPAHWLTV